MKIKGNKKEIELRFFSRGISEFGDLVGGDTYLALNCGAEQGNVKILALLLKIFSKKELTEDQVFDFIDDYSTKEIVIDEITRRATIDDIYSEIFTGMNKEAFISKKYNPKIEEIAMDALLIQKKVMNDMVPQMAKSLGNSM